MANLALDEKWFSVRQLVDADRDNVAAVIAYGSVVNSASPGRGSALDVFLLVDSYREFWERLQAAEFASTPIVPWLSRILPPTTVLVGGSEALAKVNVVSMDDFVRDMSGDARDHFLRGRLSQAVKVRWARDDIVGDFVESTIARARALTVTWVPSYIEGAEFSVEEYIQAMIRVSYRYEIRPESRSRADEVAAAQASELVPIFQPILEQAVAAGKLEQSTNGQAYVRPELAVRQRGFFLKSWARSVGRLPKYALLTRGWAGYLVKKLRRRIDLSHPLDG